MPRFTVRDTITIGRSVVVEAADADAAIEWVIDNGMDGLNYQEEQIDNTPYEAEPIGDHDHD